MAAKSSAQGAALAPTLCPGDQAGARGAGIGYCRGGNYSGSDNFLVYSLGGNFQANFFHYIKGGNYSGSNNNFFDYTPGGFYRANFFHYFKGGSLSAGGDGHSGRSGSRRHSLPESLGRCASARPTIEDTI